MKEEHNYYDLPEIRRISNTRIKVFGLDKSDIDYTLMFWALFYLMINIFSGTILNYFNLSSGTIVLFALVSIFPIAIIVKLLKSGKTKGHLEYLKYSFTNIKEGKKTRNIFLYNLRKNGFVYKTLFYTHKKK